MFEESIILDILLSAERQQKVLHWMQSGVIVRRERYYMHELKRSHCYELGQFRFSLYFFTIKDLTKLETEESYTFS